MSRGLFETVERRLLALVIRPAATDRVVSPQLLERLLAFLYLAGATIGLVSMAFPQPPDTSVAGLLTVYGVAYAVGALLFLGRSRLPAWSAEAGLAFGTALITLAIEFTNARTGVYSMFYIWVSICSFYFLPWGRAVFQVGLVGAAFAAVLALQDPIAPAEQWVITAGTVVVAGLLVGLLRRGVERLIEDLAEAARTDHARLYAAERAARLEADRATESLRRLQQVTDVALTHLNLEDLLDELLGRVVEVLSVDNAAILLLEDGDSLAVRAAKGLDEQQWRGCRIPVGAGFAGRGARGGRTQAARC